MKITLMASIYNIYFPSCGMQVEYEIYLKIPKSKHRRNFNTKKLTKPNNPTNSNEFIYNAQLHARNKLLQINNTQSYFKY